MSVLNHIKAIIFDLDQTLLDSWEVHRQSIVHAAQRSGRQIPSSERIRKEFCGVLEEHIERLFGSFDQVLFDHYVQFYQENHLGLTSAFPDVQKVLVSLRANTYHLAVCSNKRRSTAVPELDVAGLSSYFETMLFRDEGFPMKPDPAGLLAMVRSFDISPNDALFVGDSPDDMLCAQESGVVSVAALWGAMDKEALLDTKPDIVWYNVTEYAQTVPIT